jgi:hypothetical protein
MQMTARLAVAVLAGALALAAVAHASPPSRVIQGSRQIGSFQTEYDHGQLKYAIAAFGRPASLTPRRDGYTCVASWASLALTMTYNSATCSKSSCFISAVVTGKEWRTAKGLRVGDSLARLRLLYPKAKMREGLEALEIDPALEGTVVGLGARMSGGRVAAIRVYPCCPCEA